MARGNHIMMTFGSDFQYENAEDTNLAMLGFLQS